MPTEAELNERMEYRLTQLRLRTAAALPLLRVALEHRQWELVDAALDELEGKGTVIDLRAYVAHLG
jgi:hypothetical protein